MSALTLIPCVSERENNIAYQFRLTGQRVFSLEEALFYVFHNWRQCVDDFCGEEFEAWVRDALGLPYHASRIKRLAGAGSFSERLIGFLQILDYFGSGELSALNGELGDWEKRLEWEKLKERGDYAMSAGEPAMAAALYRRALFCRRDPRLLNNIGVAMMELELFPEALAYLEEAVKQLLDGDVEAEAGAAPGGTRVRMLVNYAEAAVYAHSFGAAESCLKDLSGIAERHVIEYLYGELEFEAGKPATAAERFETAIALKPERRYIYRLAEVCAKLRSYGRAEDALFMIPEQDAGFYMKLAEINAAEDDPAAAAKATERAIEAGPPGAELWTRLAAYRRLDRDAEGAQSAIEKALAADPENDRARLEQARIRKAAGRTKEYQQILRGMLREFKEKYRETYGEM
ncbi:MAG: tetratricopeptide repeat protein [Firmicutes bacterium]|nr:tetratricopeptide repeat protein [Bacillota bacterium]